MSYGDQGVAPTPEGLPHDQLSKIKLPEEKWTDDYALRVVRSDFAYAEAYRTHAHDWRYRNASELYLGWVGQKYWDGTRIPRSSLGIYVIFGQIESMLPKIVSAITDPDGYQFYTWPDNDPDISSAWRRLITRQLSDKGISAREHLRRGCKSSLLYGNGIIETGVEDYYENHVMFEREHRPTRMATYNHPLVGQIPVPVDTEEFYSRKTTKEKQIRPYLRYVSVIDSYVDPNCESSSLQDAGYFIKRVYMSAEDVKLLKNSKDFNIPDDKTLTDYSKSKTTANQDVTKLSAELFRYNIWNPAMDYSTDPGQKRIEVIEYTTPARKVWLLNREHVAYNQPNKYGKINYWSIAYADVLDRWHALAISDVVEGEQRLQQVIINARQDELALSIHRPMVKRRGVTIPSYQLKVRPGVVIETEVPEGDIKQLDTENITQQAYVEVAASAQRSQSITGITDLAAVGVPSAGGNSANRTATGVNTQVGATQDRIRYYIENTESTCIEPILNEFIWLDKKFLDMKRAANWIRMDKELQHLDPLDVMNAVVYAECRGAAKMGSRQAFLQIFPQVAQTFLNPEYLTLLAQQQKKTFNVRELESMVFDALSYSPKGSLIIDLTPEQIKSMGQPPPEAQMQAQMQQQQMAMDKIIHDNQNITKLLSAMLKEFMGHHQEMSRQDQADSHKMLDMAAQQQEQDNQPESDNA